MTFKLGYEGAPADTVQSVADGKTVKRPSPDPVRPGWVFDGWFDGEVGYDFNEPVTQDLVLVARWTEGDGGWSLSPNQGPSTGGTQVTLTPPVIRNVRLTEISAGYYHSLGLGSDGKAYDWGDNASNQLGTGDGSTTDIAHAITVDPPAGVKFVQISAGGYHNLALGDDGIAYAWGNADSGELGNNDTSDVDHPVQVHMPVNVHFTQISAGRYHNLAIGDDNNLYAWGLGSDGQLGNDKSGDQREPIKVNMPNNVHAVKLSAGGYHSLAICDDGNTYAWGRNSDGQLGIGNEDKQWHPAKVKTPSNVHFTQIATGDEHSLALGDDGVAYGWGDNNDEEVGDGTSTDRDAPVPIKVPNGIHLTWISAGMYHSLAVGDDHHAYAWGRNADGALGDNTTDDKSTPIRVSPPDGLTDETFTVARVFAGSKHSMAIGRDGITYAWGLNSDGQLGDRTNRERHIPVKVSFPPPSFAVNVTSVKFDGISSTTTPKHQTDDTWLVTSPPHAAGWVDVSIDWTQDGRKPTAHLSFRYYAGAKHTVYFLESDDGPQLSTQSVIDRDRASRPATDPSKDGYLFDGWFINKTQVAYDFSKPVTDDLKLSAHWSPKSGAWTINPDKGTSAGGTHVTLAPPAPRGIRFSQVSAGYYHSLAVASDGNIYAWGNNDQGELGDGTTTSTTTPVLVKNPDHVHYVQVSAGQFHSLALDDQGRVWAWGSNEKGQAGSKAASKQTTPVQVVTSAGKSLTAVQISAGYMYSTDVDANGYVWSWGLNNSGELGNAGTPAGTDKYTSTPVQAVKADNTPLRAAQVSAGRLHTLAVDMDGTAWAWGSNANGQLGDGTTTGQAWPVQVKKTDGTAFKAFQVSAGGWHSLALDDRGTVWAWGDNENKQLGVPGAGVELHNPGQVTKADSTTPLAAVQVSAGDRQAMIVDADGSVWAWGDNSQGQLGNNTAQTQSKPVQTLRNESGSAYNASQVSTGVSHSLGLATDGSVQGWGSNSKGQLGTGDPLNAVDRLPANIPFPSRGVATGVLFDRSPGTGLKQNGDGTWDVITPKHTPVMVTVTIHWTLDSVTQPDDTNNQYLFLPVGALPNAGGEGIGVAMVIGLLAMSIMAANRSRRNSMTAATDTNTSLE